MHYALWYFRNAVALEAYITYMNSNHGSFIHSSYFGSGGILCNYMTVKDSLEFERRRLRMSSLTSKEVLPQQNTCPEKCGRYLE